MKVLLIGCRGKMGRKMEEVIKESGHLCFGVDKDDFDRAFDYDGDVILDFSSSEALKQNVDLAAKKNIPIVIATTNHSPENLKYIEEKKNLIPIFMSSNFSIMFNLLLKMAEELKALKDCDFIVTETHHKQKKDSPSGSCKEILQILEGFGVNADVSCHRAGEIVGEHDIRVISNGEELRLSHNAFDRKIFCEGALKCCEFVINKSSGFYAMKDFFGSAND